MTALIEAQATGLKCFVSDNIQQLAILSNDVYPLSLKVKPKIWANKILKYAINYKRKNNKKLIERNNFDIKKVTKDLEKFYIKHSN